MNILVYQSIHNLDKVDSCQGPSQNMIRIYFSSPNCVYLRYVDVLVHMLQHSMHIVLQSHLS